MKFKDYLIEKSRIFRKEKTDRWSPDEDAFREGNRTGLKMIGIGLLNQFFKKHQAKDFIFWETFKGEPDSDSKQKSGERLCRYNSRVTAIGGMILLCLLNADKGYMKFIENIDEDPEPEDRKWSKAFKFDYLRVTY